MGLYDIAKTQKIMAENQTDKEISEKIYDLCRLLVKELAEDFQIIDHSFENLISELKELNMPHKPNPFQNWHDVDLKIDKKDQMSILNDGSPKMMVKYLKNAKKNKLGKYLKANKFTGILKKTINGFMNKKRRNSSAKKGKQKVINESLIKKAIEETDCNLNLNQKKKEEKKEKLDTITILTYVAKCFALLGKKVKFSMNKHKKNTNLFADAIMPVSMKPRLIVENFETVSRKRSFNSLGRKNYNKWVVPNK